MKIPVVVAEFSTLVADVAAVVPDPLPVAMHLTPVFVCLLPLRLRADFVATTEVATLESVMMPKLTSMMMKILAILAEMTTILTKVLSVFPALAHVLVDVLTVPRGVAGGLRLREARRRDAGRRKRG